MLLLHTWEINRISSWKIKTSLCHIFKNFNREVIHTRKMHQKILLLLGDTRKKYQSRNEKYIFNDEWSHNEKIVMRWENVPYRLWRCLVRAEMFFLTDRISIIGSCFSEWVLQYVLFSESNPWQGQVILVSSQFSLKSKFNLELQRKPWCAFRTFSKFYIKNVQASGLYYNYYCIVYILQDVKIYCVSLKRPFWWFLNTRVSNCHLSLKMKI